MSATEDLPNRARVVVAGGGIVGCSVAYHVARAGWSDVLLLEQAALGGGTTWHAAGLVGRLRASNSLTRINKASAELYAGLEAETGVATGWNQVGSLVVARSAERMAQLHRTAAMARLFDVEAHVIGPAECGERWPPIRTDDLLGGVWLPHDGKVVPADVARALATGAQGAGATVREGVRVDGVELENGRVRAVRTDRGEVECEVAVLCGGMWTRELASRCGVDVPLFPVEHHYVVTEPLEGVHDDLPVGRDPDEQIYFRSKGDSIVLGAFQDRSVPWDVDRIPADFSFQLLEPDWPKFAQPLAAGKHRIPALASAAFPEFVNGPESFTPDNDFILGEAPGLDGLFVAAGFNSVGIASAGGAGRALAEWLVEGAPTMDLSSVDPRRFAPFHNTRAFLRSRVAEVLGLHYQMAWPNRELETGRGVRRTALHATLAARGACFGQKYGWERPNWFARAGEAPVVDYSFGRQNWHAASGEEHTAAREAVAVFEQSSFGKLLVRGPDACAVLQWVCGNDVDVEPGRAVYTGLFNARGTFESDLTVLRTAEDEFRLVTATAQPRRDADWLRRNTPPSARVQVVDVSSAFGVLGVMGPRSRELLSRVSGADLGNGAFPFGAAREIEVGAARALAVRITYVGELGWELHLPAEELPVVFEALHAAGVDLGLRDAGHYAINSLRLEKAYRAFGAELSPDDTPIEAGLAFALAFDKPGGFLGRDALIDARGGPRTKRLVQLVLDDPGPMLWGSEPILLDGDAVGYTTSGAYGHTLGGAVALGYVRHPGGVDADLVREGRFEVLVSGEPVPARAWLRTPYDPARERILA